MHVDNSATTAKDDLSGAISIRFVPGRSFGEYCETHIEHYDAERFEVLAIRFYYGKEIDITLYAIDKEKNSDSEDTLPVKKFRLPTEFLKDILLYVDTCNFTLTTGAYPMEDIRVINK